MWKRIFCDAIESAIPPPELGTKEKRRYYIAFCASLLLMLLGFVTGFVAGITAVFGVVGGSEAIWRAFDDASYSRQYGHIWLPISLGSGVVGTFAFSAIWHLLFIKSGYLSQAAVQRLSTNRAPTERGERIRVGIGYVVYLLIFFGLGIPMAIFGDRTPLQIISAIGLNILGVYTAIHAFLRYRRINRAGDD